VADIKTNLRELSVGFYFYRDQNKLVTPRNFLANCSSHIFECMGLDINQIATRSDSFNAEEFRIIENGLNLGRVIKEVFNVTDSPTIRWVGSQTQSGKPVDLIIDTLEFSLKEESHILENMGLYKIMNLIMDQEKYKRGLHVFEDFAPIQLREWFDVTRELLMRCGPFPFIMTTHGYQSIARMDRDQTLSLTYKTPYKEITSIITDFPTCDYDRFQRSTKSVTREEVFSKWIKISVESDEAYLNAKKK
jgi:hypothetical protein